MAAYAWNGSKDPKSLILNFARVRSMNGLGASMLVKLSARAKKRDRTFRRLESATTFEQIFKVTELDQAIQIHATETDALSAAGVPGRAIVVAGSRET